MIEKKCSKCKLNKHVNEFNKSKLLKSGLRSKCKKCEKEYKTKNKEKIKNSSKLYYIKNKEKIKQQQKEYYKNNKNKIQEYNKKNNNKLLLQKRLYRKNNRKKLNIYYKNLYKNNANYRVVVILRSRLIKILKLNTFKKDNKTMNYVGCSKEYLIKYLGKKICKQCKNINNIHIDHIVPFNYYIKECGGLTEENIYKVMNYKNLQYLCSSCNLSKNGKYVK